MKKLGKDALELTKTTFITSMGASLVSKAGGDASSLKTLSESFPIVASASGAGSVLRTLKKLKI